MLCLALRRHVYLQALLFDGHVLSESTQGLTSPMHPFRTSGAFLARSERQVFAKTNQLLQMGMCGGPVIDAADLDVCYGIVEGIVPEPSSENEGATPSKGRQLLSGAAVFVEASDIRRFLTHVEDVLIRS
jgi:hypothetical protein